MHKLNPALHDCCRIISGCLKPTHLDSVHILAGIAPPHIRRTVACRMERTRQTTDARHQLFHHQPAASRLKSRKSFMRTVTPLDSSASSSRMRLWKDSPTDVPASVKMGLEVAQSLPAGSGEDWLCWRALNRLRTGVGRAKRVMIRWGSTTPSRWIATAGSHILLFYLFIMSYLPRSTPSMRSTVLPGAPALHA